MGFPISSTRANIRVCLNSKIPKQAILMHVESDSSENQPVSAAADSRRRQLVEKIERDLSKVCLAVV